ncbi:MAG: sugar phosphate isomerase/epimerase [Draconibacterium sp.]|nr:sugar phosphate isomerase/epimerase [Draconibacterium sp.]
MEIVYCCAWWGLDHLGMEGMVSKIKSGGFDGIEVGIPFNDKEQTQLRKLLDKFDLQVIAHQYQAEGTTFSDFVKSFKYSLEQAARFQPLLINSHTGKDFWSIEENGVLIEIAQEISDKYGITVAHETHRGRFLFSTFAAKQYFEKFPNLKINFDISHWCCVSESLLEDQPQIVEEAIKRTEHIHARVGHAQGAQITDPRLPEWETEVNTFINWWNRIVQRFRAEGRDFITITPEFGPTPYMWKIPFTQQPISNHWDINCYMKDLLKERIL